MTRLPLPAVFDREPVLAVVRGPADRSDLLVRVCETLVDAGLRHLEVTTNTGGWQSAVRRMASLEGVAIGVGTVLYPHQVDEANDLGATFVVAPDTNPDVGAAAARAGLPWYPGALTPTEITRAWDLGATAVKVFPWRALGGVSYLTDLRGPLPDIPLIPTGGVSLDQIQPLLTLGAAGLGIGTPLLGPVFVDCSLTDLAERCHAVLAEVELSRSGDGAAS